MDALHHNTYEICDVCGDVGYGEVVFTCSRCRMAREHIYCMSVHNLENVPESWVCESCKANTKLIDESEHQFQPKTQTHSETPNVASVVGLQPHQTFTLDSQDMATRRTSVFEYEQRRDKPPTTTPRQCIRLPTRRCLARVLDGDPSLPPPSGENQLPNINPFVFQGPYSSEADEDDYLNRAFHIWQALEQFPMEGDSGFSDPRQGFIFGLHDFRQAFTRLTISFGRIGDELNRFYLNYVPREELARAQASSVRANRLLEEAKVELESCRASYKVEIDELKAELDEAKSRLCDAKYLAEEFKKTEEFMLMQNNIIECGVNWSVRQASKEYPRIDFGFLQIRFKAECEALDNDFDEMGMETSAARGGGDQF